MHTLKALENYPLGLFQINFSSQVLLWDNLAENVCFLAKSMKIFTQKTITKTAINKSK